jgi:integrase
MKLTQDAIAKVKRTAAGKSEHLEWDDALAGFGLRVRNGRCTWIAQYKIGSKNRRVTLGTTDAVTADEARNGWKREGDQGSQKGARDILNDARHGIDYVVSRATRRKEASDTLEASIAAYLETKKPSWRPRSYAETRRYLENCWKPLYSLPMRHVTRAQVAAQTGTVAKQRGLVSANRARSSLSAFFRWAIGEGLCEENPVAGTNKQEENGPRERSLTDAEAAAIWLACPANDFGRIVKLLMLTGCRRDEIGALRWSEIDLKANTITLPAARTKNKVEHTVPLSELAIAVLAEIKRIDGRDLVFGRSDYGFLGWSKSKTWLDEKLTIAEWRLHDLRRTVRTGLGKLGIAPHVAEAVLNHLPPRLVRTYDRNTYAVEKQTALNAWATHLNIAIAKAKGENVVSLRA